jgi:hypothetical protein
LSEQVQKFLKDLEAINFIMERQIIGVQKIDTALYLLNDLVLSPSPHLSQKMKNIK